MMALQFTAEKFGWTADENGEKLTIYAPKAKELAAALEKGKKYSVSIQERKKRRSMNANAYLWALLTQCAEALGTTKEELYIRYVRKCGPYKDFTLTEDEARTFRAAWSRLGTGWPTEQVDFSGEDVVIRAYYGSSTYSVRRMSRLIDMVVEDAKEAGIDVMSEKDRALLLNRWKPVSV